MSRIENRAQTTSQRSAWARRFRWLVPLVALIGCKTRTQKAQSTDEECGPPIRGAEQILQKGVTVLLGELHGTNEMPRAVGDLACRAARSGAAVRVGLEMDQEFQTSIDQFLASAGTTADRAALLNEELWHPEWPDGRTSLAAVELLERLRRLRQQGLDVGVFMLTQASRYQESREKLMADSIQQVRTTRPDALILVEAGNNHTRLDVDAETGGILMRRGRPVLSLNMQFSNGTYWGCPVPCGARQATWGKDLGTERFVEMRDIYIPGSAIPAYHGVLYVGAITAAPPAAE